MQNLRKNIKISNLIIRNQPLKKNNQKIKESNLNTSIEILKKGEAQFEWDETIFNFTLEKTVVHKDKSITFKLYTWFVTTANTFTVKN